MATEEAEPGGGIVSARVTKIIDHSTFASFSLSEQFSDASRQFIGFSS